MPFGKRGSTFKTDAIDPEKHSCFDFAVVSLNFAFELVQFLCEFAVQSERLPEADEYAHDGDVHPHRA